MLTCTVSVWLGRSAGRVCGRGELATSWLALVRTSQMSPTEPTPPAAQGRVPVFVIGTPRRATPPVSAITALRGTWKRAFAGGSRIAL